MNTKEEIKCYISQKSNNGALLVTGEWGCGKTHLIRQIIKEVNQGQEYLAVIVSLFGVDSIELLHKEIKDKVFFGRGFEKVDKKSSKGIHYGKKISVSATEILGETFSIAKSINKLLTIRWQDYFNVEKEINCYSATTANKKHLVKKRLILFFDDFERSKMDRVELMGVINEYSENRGIKVVIIADEDKITDEINDKNETYKYSEIKEKLISRTIKIKANYIDIIDSIIASYEETVENYSGFLSDNKDVIYSLFIESHTNNFRSLKAFITDYERVYEALKDLNISDEEKSGLFYNFGAMLFCFKNGEYREGKYGFLFSDVTARKIFSRWSSTYELKTFQNWIVKGIWDKEQVKSEINLKFNKDILTVEEKFISYSIWDLQQSDIEEGMPKVLKMAYDGDLSRDQLISLLKKIHSLKSYSVCMPCQVDYLKIKNGFELRKKRIMEFEIEEPKRHTFSEKSCIEEDAYDIYDDIESFDNKLYVLESRRIFIEYLKSDNKSACVLKDKLIGCFDTQLMELFYNKYLTGDNAQKRDISFLLLGISFSGQNYLNNDEIEETIKNLNELKTRIEKCNENEKDYITSIINISFSNNLADKIAEIRKDSLKS